MSDENISQNLPSYWTIGVINGKKFFCNSFTKTAQTLFPIIHPNELSDEYTILPNSVEMRKDYKSRAYYINHKTKTTSWDVTRTLISPKTELNPKEADDATSEIL